MGKRLLDSSVLISHWHRRAAKGLETVDTEQARGWADELTRLHDSDLIVTPVQIEFLAGVTTSRAMQLAEAYLSRFRVLDEGNIPRQDWEAARGLAVRVPRDGKRRQLGDCLIAAIAKRLKCDVFTLDKRFYS